MNKNSVKMKKEVGLITGASSGIGKATAILLNKNGFTVYAAARRLDRMKDIENQGVHILLMDVTDDKSLMEGVELIIKKENHIDVLVNNAGYGSYGALEDVTIAEAKRQFDVNIFGLARLTQLVLPFMRKQKSGRIINISSIGGKFGEPLGVWYHATKYAVEGLSDSLRPELKPFGIDTIIVQPGAINTEWGGISFESMEKASGKTAYAPLVKLNEPMYRRMTDKQEGSDPIVIAKVILKAIRAKQPKTRYAAGKFAKLSLLARSILSDRCFDWMMDKVRKMG